MRKIILVLTGIILLLTGYYLCWKTNEPHMYYISQAHLYLTIEKRATDVYRIYIAKSNCRSSLDFIDVRNSPSDMPGISICCIPSIKDTLYILDRWGEVININEKRYHIITSTITKRNGYGWSDSTIFKNPNIQIQVNPYMNGFSTFDIDGKYIKNTEI